MKKAKIIKTKFIKDKFYCLSGNEVFILVEDKNKTKMEAFSPLNKMCKCAPENKKMKVANG